MVTENNAPYRLNTTDDYHKEGLESLGWELTVCNSLFPENSPLRKILKANQPYGRLLYDFLDDMIPLGIVNRVLEIGGGYGYLMRDFLERNPGIRASMLDISPALLAKQKEMLQEHTVEYYLRDAMESKGDFFRPFELVIFNENLGDFPTLVNLDNHILDKDRVAGSDPVIERLYHFFDGYALEKPNSRFNFNLGALEMIEKVCSVGVPYVFIGEHSCESQAPQHLKPFFDIVPSGNPRRISLKGHDEFTIKFSYLEKVANDLGYHTKRGPFADFAAPNIDDNVKAVLTSRGRYSDNEEIIYQFIGDLFEYEYLILTKQ